jgi:hypothetical protein
LISALWVDWKNGELTHEQYRKMKEKFEKQQTELSEATRHIKGEIGTMEQGIAHDDPYLQAFLKHKNIQELSQGILVELIDTIYVHEGGELTIKFKAEDQYKRIVDFIENNKYTLTVVENAG